MIQEGLLFPEVITTVSDGSIDAAVFPLHDAQMSTSAFQISCFNTPCLFHTWLIRLPWQQDKHCILMMDFDEVTVILAFVDGRRCSYAAVPGRKWDCL